MKRFKVAFSFAGEKRGYVKQVASLLADRFGRETVLYDKFHEAELARANLGMYLPDLYINQTELNVVIFCSNYAHKSWCGLEWRALHSLLADRRDEELMLARFEYAAPPAGVYANTAGFIELDERSPEAFADLIVQRHGMLNLTSSPADLNEENNDLKVMQGVRSHDTIEDLRTAMSKAGLHEHVLDMETITPAASRRCLI